MPPPTFLIDGAVAGTWRLDRSRGGLDLHPFAPIGPTAADDLRREALGMLRLLLGDDHAEDVRILTGDQVRNRPRRFQT